MTRNYFKNYQLILQHEKVFQSLVFVLYEIEQIQEILRFSLIMVNSQQRNKGWKALVGISIDCGKSLKLEVEFFFKSWGSDEDKSLRYISKKRNLY